MNDREGIVGAVRMHDNNGASVHEAEGSVLRLRILEMVVESLHGSP